MLDRRSVDYSVQTAQQATLISSIETEMEQLKSNLNFAIEWKRRVAGEPISHYRPKSNPLIDWQKVKPP